MGRPGGTIRTGTKAIETAEKERQALELKLAGFDLSQIAGQLGYTHASAAQKAIKRALRKTIQEPADELRVIELRRLDKMQAGLWRKAIAGDVFAVDRVIKIMDRRAKLLGLDAPLKINLDVLIQQAADQFDLDPAEVAELHSNVAAFLESQREVTV